MHSMSACACRNLKKTFDDALEFGQDLEGLLERMFEDDVIQVDLTAYLMDFLCIADELIDKGSYLYL